MSELLDHIIDLKTSMAEQVTLLKETREDVKTHSAAYGRLNVRVERLEVWPKAGKMAIKLIIALASLVTGAYGLAKILQDRPGRTRPDSTEVHASPSHVNRP